MAGKRRQHTAEFKAQVVLSVLARGKRRYGRDLSSCLLFYGIVWVKGLSLLHHCPGNV